MAKVLKTIFFTSLVANVLALNPDVGQNPEDLDRRPEQSDYDSSLEIEPRSRPSIIEVDVNSIRPRISNRAANTCNGPSIPLASTSRAKPYFLTYDSSNLGLFDMFSPCKFTFDIPANTLIIINVTIPIDCGFLGSSLTMGPAGVSPPSIDFCQNSAKVYGISPKPTGFQFEIIYRRGTFSSGVFALSLYSNTTTASNPGGNPTNSCKCGIYADRIVGGFVANPNAFPYQIGLMLATSTKPFCGGSIISNNFVLTAAHCTRDYVNANAKGLRVSVGDVDFLNSTDGAQYINVAKITIHPNYNSSSQELDFSLLQLEQPIVFSSRVGAACLPPDTSAAFVGENLTISGWGLEAVGGSQSAKLKGAFVTGISNSDCSATGYKSAIKASMICAYNYPKNDTDTCQGDSGGPLAATVNGKVTLVGVTSFGVGCGGNYPGVYARVTNQKDWILSNSDAGSCQ